MSPLAVRLLRLLKRPGWIAAALVAAGVALMYGPGHYDTSHQNNLFVYPGMGCALLGLGGIGQLAFNSIDRRKAGDSRLARGGRDTQQRSGAPAEGDVQERLEAALANARKVAAEKDATLTTLWRDAQSTVFEVSPSARPDVRRGFRLVVGPSGEVETVEVDLLRWQPPE
jgi:hypothetical protein